MSEMKNTLNKIRGRLNSTEKKISELENKAIKIITQRKEDGGKKCTENPVICEISLRCLVNL